MVRHPGTRALLVGLAALSVSLTARAQPAEDAGTPPTVDAPNVLFLMPAFDADTQNQLRDALLAQFAQLGATLSFEDATAGPESLSERVTRVQALAERKSAIAAFWIEDQGEGRWFVYMMDSELERILVRPVDAQPDRRSAAIEALAVMARESTRALMEGTPPPGSSPIPPPPPPPSPPAATVTPPPPAPAAPDHSAMRFNRPLRVAVGYAGTAFAKQVDWQHGLMLDLSWIGLVPFYAGIGYLFAPALERAATSDSGSIGFEVARRPLSAHAGLRYTQDRIALDAQLGLALEWLSRTTNDPTGQGAEATVISRPDTRRLLVLSPRVRVELRALPSLAFYAAGGADILINHFSYVLKKPGSEPDAILLDPYHVRPVAEAGIAFYP